MNILATKILNDLKASIYAPLYILQGEETYYIDLISEYIETHVLSASEKSFNQTILYGKDISVATLLSYARQFPMGLSDRQVVIVREAQDIPDLLQKKGTHLMLHYISNPVPSTILVLCYNYKTLDKRTELGKKISMMKTAVVFKKMYDSQLPNFVRHYVKERQRYIDDMGVEVLCDYVGSNLKRMVSEIDKILITSLQGELITAAKVMSQVGISREYNIFELQNALICKDIAKAFKVVNYFTHNVRKTPIIPIVAFLYSFYSRLLVASTIRNCDEKKLINTLHISPFVARTYLKALHRCSSHHIVTYIRHIATADLHLKGIQSGMMDDGQVLKKLVYQLLMNTSW